MYGEEEATRRPGQRHCLGDLPRRNQQVQGLTSEGPLERQLEEAVRIKVALLRGFLMLGQGQKTQKLKVHQVLLNIKMKNLFPWFLTLGGGEGGD